MIEPEAAAVVLVDAGPAAVHDGASLASFLRCQVRSYRSTPQLDPTMVAGDLAAGALSAVFMVAEEHSLEGLIRVGKLLPPGTTRVLCGRLFDDARLRGGASSRMDGVVVGEPYLTARALLRGLPWADEQPALPGLLRAGEQLVPREPLRDLNSLPPGDYRDLPREVALQVPLHPGRGYPHPCLFAAERVWELPVRRRSVDRVLADLELHAGEHGARHIVFTDQCLNTSTSWLLELCQGIIEAGLELSWHGRVWADPLLDRPAVRLLRRGGCRGLEVDLFTASTDLSRALATGVDPDGAAELVRRCDMEGIPARVRLLVGPPGEQEGDRLATMAWLEEHRGRLRGISSLEPCVLREGAPLRGCVHLPANDDPAAWHDGADNNASRRATLARELAQWLDGLGLWRPRPGPRGFSGRVGQGVQRRLTERVADWQASSPGWRSRHLLEAGVLHGREALRGPRCLELEIQGMEPAAAAAVLEQARGIGTRQVVLSSSLPERDEPLLGSLERAAELDLAVTLRATLEEVDSADWLREVARRIVALEATVAVPRQWQGVSRWFPVIAEQRSAALQRLPRLVLRVDLDREADLDVAVQSGLDAGADRLHLELRRDEPGRMDGARRQQAREALLRWLEQAVLETPFEPPEQGWSAELEPALLVPRAGWPAGFVLERARGTLRLGCPAGVTAEALRGLPGDPDARYAAFARQTCLHCGLLAGCPVDRVDFHVRLGLTRLVGAGQLLADLDQADCGLGQRARRAESQPCLAGWDAARVDRHGQLWVCGECGSAPVGNVLEEGFAAVWYGRALNEFRQMAASAARALPYVERSRCGAVCRRLERHAEIAAGVAGLSPGQRRALQGLGAGDRRQGCDPDHRASP